MIIRSFQDTYFSNILIKIKRERNLDFSQYRSAVLARRVLARAGNVECADFKQYYDYLSSHPLEIDFLMDAMTINVTEFFRDANVFDLIENKVIPCIFSEKNKGNLKAVNIWSCGASSGEEAYSVLMLIAEYLGGKLDRYKLKIFGTDIDNTSLAKAREAVYEATQFKNLSLARRELVDKYFYNMQNERYWAREEWPAYMNFTYHDITVDPPFKRVDLILCRNLFIYFNRQLQEQVLGKFYNSLNRGGFLVLGAVEAVLKGIGSKFVEYDRRFRIYRKLD